MMFIPNMLQNAITYSSHIYHLQWNIEGMLFLFHTKRLNPNLRKKFKNKFKFLNSVLKSNFITYNVMKGIHCCLLEIQTEKYATWPITRLSKQRPIQTTWHLLVDFIGLLSFDDHFRIFTQTSFLIFIL